MTDTMDKITEIPEVAGLEFDDSTHTYRLDGLVIPSVTSVMAPLSKAKYAGISERTLDKAADKGTAIHNSIENWIKFGIEDIPPEHIGYFEAFRMWWDEFTPVVVGSEIRIFHNLMQYGGTADLIAYIAGELTLVDYKSTYVISDMTCGVQLEGYTQALKSMGVPIQRKRILHLKKDGRYDFREYPMNDIARWRVFGALKTVYDYVESSK
ncbi:hypothetical protein [Anaerotruncus colihominis]|uniref:hypothetical protein n=1 Tax=Anaerotruncus colihominis TaxID=169435 RepID=UPI00242D466C|nr:hypothetical protein [Anaerotruncus colihominis]